MKTRYVLFFEHTDYPNMLGEVALPKHEIATSMARALNRSEEFKKVEVRRIDVTPIIYETF